MITINLTPEDLKLVRRAMIHYSNGQRSFCSNIAQVGHKSPINGNVMTAEDVTACFKKAEDIDRVLTILMEEDLK